MGLDDSKPMTKKSAALEVYKVLHETRAILIVSIVGFFLIAIMFFWVRLALTMAFCSVVSYQLYKVWRRMNYLKQEYGLVTEMVTKK